MKLKIIIYFNFKYFIMEKLKKSLLYFFSKFKYENIKLPLGRWHNVGNYYDEKFLYLKEQQKKKREIMKKYNIDPYYKYNIPCYK